MRQSVIIFLLTVCVACGSSSSEDDAQVLKDKGVLDVLEEADKDSYDPPADGKLTEKQVQMYLEVKKRERDLTKVAAEQLSKKNQELKDAEKEGAGLAAAWKGIEALKGLGNLVTADIRAAQELGYNTAEYQWVKEQVLEAGLATYAHNLREETNSALKQTLQELQAAREKAPNDEMRSFYDTQITNYEKMIAEQAEQDKPPEATAHNQQLIQKYADDLKLLEEEIRKYGLAYGSGREGR